MDPVSFSKSASKSGQKLQIRIGDAERQAAARDLQQHYADGRLTWQELDERLQVAYAARVQDELEPLFHDLPALPPPPAPPATARSWAEGLMSQLRGADLRAVLLLAIVAMTIASALSWHFVPLVLIWTFVVLGRRGRHSRYRHHYGHHHHR